MHCRMGSVDHSITCHPAEMRIPPLPPAEAGTRFSDPGVDLRYVKVDQLGIEPRDLSVACPTPYRSACFCDCCNCHTCSYHVILSHDDVERQ